MAENNTEATTEVDTSPEEKKASRTRTRRNFDTVTVRGRISTTYLRSGQEATVTRTEHVDQLLAAGYVTEIN